MTESVETADNGNGSDDGPRQAEGPASAKKRLAAMGQDVIDYRADEVHNDASYAIRFASLFAERVSFIPGSDWQEWDGRRWKSDTLGGVMELAKQLGHEMLDYARGLDDQLARGRLLQRANRVLQDSRLRSILRSASTIPGIVVGAGAFDADPRALNCANGVLYLPARTLQPHGPLQFHRKLANVEFQPEAVCPTWKRFLATVFEDDEELIRFVQKIAGYCLTGLTIEDKFFFLQGKGRNGKGVFVDTLQEMPGDYANQMSSETLLKQRGATNTYDLARLPGSRLVAASETDKNRQLSEAQVKQITGGDRLAVRNIYSSVIEYRPQYKLLISTNYLPRVNPDDVAMWERICVIPFRVYISPEERDLQLREKLKRELPGILNWAVEGYERWASEGLGRLPNAILNANLGYQQEVDPVRRFIDQECTLDAHSATPFGDLHDSYARWSSELGEVPMSKAEFGRKLGHIGFPSTKGTGGQRRRCGLRLNPNPVADFEGVA